MTVRYCFLLLLGLLAGYAGRAQQRPPATISGDFQRVPFAEFARQVAATTPYRLYYNPADVDSLRVTMQVAAQPLDTVLRRVLHGTTLHAALDPATNRVFITAGAAIETQLPAGFWLPPAAGPPPPVAGTALPAPGQAASTATASRVYTIGEGGAPGSTATLTGRVRDARSGEPVVGASVYAEAPNVGTATDQYGTYTLTLPVGSHRLNVRGISIRNTTRLLLVRGNGRLDLDVEEDITQLKEVVVEAEKDRNVSGLQMGVEKLDIKTIRQVPTALGEADILRVVLLLPGVKSVGEGNTGFSVRGGGTDQNLVLYNDAVVYNPTHLFGFFSAFNPDMVKTAELYKGTVPARFGGRLSSVLDVTTRAGNAKKFAGLGGVGPLTGRLTLEGPLGKSGSFLVGGRTTYSDWLLGRLSNKALSNSTASFYDLSGHVSYDLSERNSLYATGYYSSDRFRLASDTLYAYRNTAGSLKWKHTLSNRHYGVLTGTFSRYQYGLSSENNMFTAFRQGYTISQGGVQADLSLYLNARHTIEYGGSSLLYVIDAGNQVPLGVNSLIANVTLPTERAVESALYVADRFEVTPRLSVVAGLRYSFYQALGPRTVRTYQPDQSRSAGTVLGSYESERVLASYGGPEPRVSARYAFSDISSVKASYTRMRQYLHQLTNTTVVSPTDIWKLSDTYIRPQVGDQVSLGYYRNFRHNTVELSVETYYRTIENFLDYKGGAVLQLNPNLETEVVNARGRAYGVEVLLRKSTGKLNGWLAYTYARSLVQVNNGFDVVNNGDWYPSNIDKPHEVTLVGNYRVNRRFSVSLNANYSTGRPITLPLLKYYYNNAPRVLYSDRNAYRVPDYFRLDLAINVEGNHKIKKLSHNFWTFGVYNLTGRRNPYSVYYQTQGTKINGYQLSIFGEPIPTLTYNFRF